MPFDNYRGTSGGERVTDVTEQMGQQLGPCMLVLEQVPPDATLLSSSPPRVLFDLDFSSLEQSISQSLLSLKGLLLRSLVPLSPRFVLYIERAPSRQSRTTCNSETKIRTLLNLNTIIYAPSFGETHCRFW
jgi:hypothetical protein